MGARPEMDEIVNFPEIVGSNRSLGTYEEIKSSVREEYWKHLAGIPISQAVDHWLDTLSIHTRKNYRCAIGQLEQLQFLNLDHSLQQFALYNHESIVDRIKNIDFWKETTKQARAACYISFTGFLERRTQGLIRKAIPNKEGNAKTFFRVHEKVVTPALNRAQWTKFFDELSKINWRDALIGRVILQGGKRASEVLLARIDQVDWEKRQIMFTQSKTKGMVKHTVITYPETIMSDLKGYVDDRNGLIFVTKNGDPVRIQQIQRSFQIAGKRSGMPFQVSPHILRASAVTYLKQQGFSDGDIMGMTGHCSGEMIRAYDKRSLEENASSMISIIN